MEPMGRTSLISSQPGASKSQPASTLSLSAIIVNYHQWANTARLVRQLRATDAVRGGQAEVVIVDNHSPSHPLMARLRRLPGVSLRRWRRNFGFARAANEGARLSRGDWLLFLNPDVTLTDGFVAGVLALAGTLDPAAGIVGFRLYNSDGRRQLSTGPVPTLAGTLAGLVVPRIRRKYRARHARRPVPVPWVTGCCLLVRRECWQDLGGFDPAFFLYYEDADLCLRAREAGWEVLHEPRLRAVHHRPLHLRPVTGWMRLVTRHALLTYAAKHWPAWQARLLTSIVRLEAWLRGTWARCRGDVRAARWSQRLGRLAADMANGNVHKARRRLIRGRSCRTNAG